MTPRIPPYGGRRSPKRMTIALGLLTNDCVILAADTYETDGTRKSIGQKIHAPKPYAQFAIAVTGAGPTTHLASVTEEITALFETRDAWTVSAFDGPLRQCISAFYAKHVTPLLPHMERDFRVIVAAQSPEESALWTNETTAVRRVGQFEAVGSGNPYAFMAIGNRIFRPTAEVAILLAIHAVKEAKTYDPYCGARTNVVCLLWNRVLHLTWPAIGRAEDLLSEYAGIEHSTFQYTLGQDAGREKHSLKVSRWLKRLRADMVDVSGRFLTEAQP